MEVTRWMVECGSATGKVVGQEQRGFKPWWRGTDSGGVNRWIPSWVPGVVREVVGSHLREGGLSSLCVHRIGETSKGWVWEGGWKDGWWSTGGLIGIQRKAGSLLLGVDKKREVREVYGRAETHTHPYTHTHASAYNEHRHGSLDLVQGENQARVRVRTLVTQLIKSRETRKTVEVITVPTHRRGLLSSLCPPWVGLLFRARMAKNALKHVTSSPVFLKLKITSGGLFSLPLNSFFWPMNMGWECLCHTWLCSGINLSIFGAGNRTRVSLMLGKSLPCCAITPFLLLYSFSYFIIIPNLWDKFWAAGPKNSPAQHSKEIQVSLAQQPSESLWILGLRTQSLCWLCASSFFQVGGNKFAPYEYVEWSL